MSEDTLRSGEVAARAGVNLQTVRYYERRGLLPEPARSPSGYRTYAPDAVRVVRFVKRAQALGFALREVQELLRLRADRSMPCAKVRAAARAKMSDIERRIDALRAVHSALGTLTDACRSSGTVRECPILEALEERQSTGCAG